MRETLETTTDQIRREHNPAKYEAHVQEAAEGVKDISDSISKGKTDTDVIVSGWGPMAWDVTEKGRASDAYGRGRVTAERKAPYGSRPNSVMIDGYDGAQGVSSHAVVDKSDGGKINYNASHRFSTEFSDSYHRSPTTVTRVDKAGEVYKHTFKSPEAPRLVTRLALKKIKGQTADQRPDQEA